VVGYRGKVVLLGVDVFYAWTEVAIMQQSIIVRDPEILGGIPVFRGTRVPLQNLLDYLEGGDTLNQFLQDFPSVSRESAIAALEQAKKLLIEHAG
jgi:uncharacterized protein (DUF433 family)